MHPALKNEAMETVRNVLKSAKLEKKH